MSATSSLLKVKLAIAYKNVVFKEEKCDTRDIENMKKNYGICNKFNRCNRLKRCNRFTIGNRCRLIDLIDVIDVMGNCETNKNAFTKLYNNFFLLHKIWHL
jgi:hypothetical protein